MPVHNHRESRCLVVEFAVILMVFVGGPRLPVHLSSMTNRVLNDDFTGPMAAYTTLRFAHA